MLTILNFWFNRQQWQKSAENTSWYLVFKIKKETNNKKHKNMESLMNYRKNQMSFTD